MDSAIFQGEKVRLEILDPERDAEIMGIWSQNSEYMRLMDSDPAYSWPTKNMQEFYEKNFSDIHIFMIRTLVENKPIGFVDLSGFEAGNVNCWVGIGIGERDYWDCGYGTDAMQVTLNYAFECLNLHRVTLDVFEYNLRAIRSYEKCGFVVEGRERQWLKRDRQYFDLIHMGILQREWRGLSDPGNK